MAEERNRQPRHSRAVRRHRRRPRRSGVGHRLLITLAVAAAVICGIALFFKVQNVVVKGNSVYDAAHVIEASGIEVGDNLLAIGKSAAAGRIQAALPYVEQVRIARVLPDTVVLEIKESGAVFSVKSEAGEQWLMSFSGKLLEKVTAAEGKKHPTLAGFTLQNPVPGEKAVTADGENLLAAQTVLTALDGSGLADKITAVDVTKTFDILLQYGDQFLVKLGGTDQMDYKIKYLSAVLEQLSQYQTGTIDLTFEEEKVARFIPG